MHPAPPPDESWATYAFFAIALFGAAMTPYEVFFFSSGAVEEHWTQQGPEDRACERADRVPARRAALAAADGHGGDGAGAARHLGRATCRRSVCPSSLALGKVGLAVLLVGVFAATFGAALETALSAGYTVSQYFGWQWGTFVRPKEAPRFHLVVMVSIALGSLLMLTTVDPIKVTEYSIVLAAAALPLTYFPILVVANDPEYMGDQVNGRITNAIATVYLVLLLIVVGGDDPADDHHEGGRLMAGRTLDAGLRLLDRQLIDVEGRFAGKVDDLELTGAGRWSAVRDIDPRRTRFIVATDRRAARRAGSSPPTTDCIRARHPGRPRSAGEW